MHARAVVGERARHDLQRKAIFLVRLDPRLESERAVLCEIAVEGGYLRVFGSIDHSGIE